MTKIDKPPVHTSKSGVQSVSPKDILRSTIGQKQISDMAKVAHRTGAGAAKSATVTPKK